MKKIVLFVVGLLCMLGLAACDTQVPVANNVYQLYVVSNTETKVENHPIEIISTEKEEMLEEFVTALTTQPEKLEYKVPFSMGFEVLSVEMKDSKVRLNFSEEYRSLAPTTEVLVRAAIVRTITQIPNVRYVEISVGGNPLLDRSGNIIGLMSADLFIDNDGNEINTYELARVKLYFATFEGDQLVSAFREKYYSTNMPMERFVVEELIAGPSGKVEGLYPSINPEVRIIGVTTQDGVCYVNLDSNFLTVINNVSTETSIYSIVNSLSELSNVNKVQILVNGEVPSTFSSSVYERNLDCVTTLDK